MPPWTLGSVHAETPIVVRALDAPLVLARMEVQTLAAQLALAQLDIEDAQRHRPQVEVVRVLAIVAHLAEIPQIMLADGRLLLALPRMRWQHRWSAEVVRGRLGVAVRTERGGKGAARWEEGESAYLRVW
jgi:hypothetical protein